VRAAAAAYYRGALPRQKAATGANADLQHRRDDARGVLCGGGGRYRRAVASIAEGKTMKCR